MCKHFNKTFYSSAADNLRKMTVKSPFYFIESVMEDVRLNDWAKLDISECGTREIKTTFDYINYINGRFPTKNNLITAPDG